MTLERLLEIALGNATAAVVLAIVVALVSRWVKRPAVLHLLWLVVLARLLAPPVLEVALLPSPEAAPAAPGLLQAPAIVLPPAVTQPVVTANSSFDPHAVILFAWLVGAAALVVLAAVRTLRLIRCVRAGEHPAPELRERVGELSRRMAVRPPRVRLVAGQLPPMLWGVPSRPVLILPRTLVATLRPEELDALVTHELAHLRRRDHWVRFLELAAVVLFWWNPASWWASSRLRAAEEECCDALVAARLPESSRAYADGLVKTMGFLAGVDSFFPTVVTGASHFRRLERRIRIIMTGQTVRSISAPLWAALAVVVLAVLVIAPTMATRGVLDEGRGLEAGTLFTGEPITLSLDRAVVKNVIKVFSEITRLNVLVDEQVTIGALNYRVSGEFVDVPWDQALDTLLRQAGLAWTRSGNVLWVHVPGLPPKAQDEFTGKPITLSLEDADLREVLRTVEKLTGARIEADPEVQGTVTVAFNDLPWDQALDLILRTHGFTWKLEGGVFRVSTAAGGGPVPLSAELPRDQPRTASVVDGEHVHRYVRGGAITEPVRVHTPQPPYTPEARDARVQGAVVLQTVIDTDGRVIRAEAVRSLPLGLTESALETVRQWRFEPATLAGVPVAVEYVVAVRFRLDEPSQLPGHPG